MPPIVLLHGWGIRPAVFDRLAALLSPHYAVHALPLPGYDDTLAASPYDLDGLAAAVAARAPQRCAVAGWSLGAQVALAWARARPRQIERLVLLSATPCFVQRDDWRAAMPAALFDDFAGSVRADVRGALRRFVSLQTQGDAEAGRVARTLRAVLAVAPPPPVEVLDAGLRILGESDQREALDCIEAPALVLHGERDGLTPPDAGEYLAHALPHATFATLPGAAHAPIVSDPEGVGRLMLEFLDGR